MNMLLIKKNILNREYIRWTDVPWVVSKFKTISRVEALKKCHVLMKNSEDIGYINKVTSN